MIVPQVGSLVIVLRLKNCDALLIPLVLVFTFKKRARNIHSFKIKLAKKYKVILQYPHYNVSKIEFSKVSKQRL